jgi:dihydropyrimidine dehydrogenase (NAD+) subunit PreT
MPAAERGTDIASRRLAPTDYARNFADLHPPLDAHEALVESDRCYFCYDAPCMHACPTGIDIPLFIREINTGNPLGAAKTIFDQNILGGMCARVCPTETLCEEACVRNDAEGEPVKIGLLQRHATDRAMAANAQFYKRAAPTGRRIAVVGAGPAGLACAHRLAMHGHEVTIFDAKPKPGGLNEYGIAAYKTVDDFAQREVDYILEIGGVTIENDKRLGQDFRLEELRKSFDAVFIAVGLTGVNHLHESGEDAPGVDDAVEYIAEIRQAEDLSKLAIGRRIAVIGGGMTAIDIAVQAKLLGAEDVTILYRRGKEEMKASEFEQDLAQIKGVKIKHWVRPHKILVSEGKTVGVECEYTTEASGRLKGTGERFAFPADMVFKAIGQKFEPDPVPALDLTGGRIKVDHERRTSLPGVWAGGDCAHGGQDLTVAAVEDGKRAAESIHRTLAR